MYTFVVQIKNAPKVVLKSGLAISYRVSVLEIALKRLFLVNIAFIFIGLFCRMIKEIHRFIEVLVSFYN